MQLETGCPFCGFTVATYITSKMPEAVNGIQVQCDNCAARGPVGNNEAEALSLWYNRKPAKDLPSPL
jgi:Lar family restriction alleviation protein